MHSYDNTYHGRGAHSRGARCASKANAQLGVRLACGSRAPLACRGYCALCERRSCLAAGRGYTEPRESHGGASGCESRVEVPRPPHRKRAPEANAARGPRAGHNAFLEPVKLNLPDLRRAERRRRRTRRGGCAAPAAPRERAWCDAGTRVCCGSVDIAHAVRVSARARPRRPRSAAAKSPGARQPMGQISPETHVLVMIDEKP